MQEKTLKQWDVLTSYHEFRVDLSNPNLTQQSIIVETEANMHTVKNRTGATGRTFLSSSLNNSRVATVSEWEDWSTALLRTGGGYLNSDQTANHTTDDYSNKVELFKANLFSQFMRTLTVSKRISILGLNANIVMWSSYNRCSPDLLSQQNDPEVKMSRFT